MSVMSLKCRSGGLKKLSIHMFAVQTCFEVPPKVVLEHHINHPFSHCTILELQKLAHHLSNPLKNMMCSNTPLKGVNVSPFNSVQRLCKYFSRQDGVERSWRCVMHNDVCQLHLIYCQHMYGIMRRKKFSAMIQF